MNARLAMAVGIPRSYSISLISAPVKAIHGFASVPALVFLAALAAMLFRPPDLKSFPVDRLHLLR